MYLGWTFAEFSTPLEVGVMDSRIILLPKQMGQSLVGFFPLFFTLMSTKTQRKCGGSDNFRKYTVTSIYVSLGKLVGKGRDGF